jgi:hypothetical protein
MDTKVMRIQDINEKFISNRPLNDKELEILICFYRDLVQASNHLDNTFELFGSELFRRLTVLEGFDSARKNK